MRVNEIGDELGDDDRKTPTQAAGSSAPVCSADLLNRIASAVAHRACCGTEHDPANGKFHGYCVVCGVPWPCETASAFLVKPNAGLDGRRTKEDGHE